MTLGIVVRDSVKKSIDELNFRKEQEIYQISAKNISQLCSAIESELCFTHILLDIQAVSGNGDDFIQMLLRLSQSTTIEFLVLLDGYPSDSRIVLELQDFISPKNILFSAQLALKQRLSELFATACDSPLQPFTPIPLAQTPEPVQQENIAEREQEQSNQLEIQSKQADFHQPPSQVTTLQAHAILQQRMLQIQKENLKTATTIAVAGAGTRIGTTTQALQMLLYLKTQNKAVALIEMHPQPCLSSYVSVYPDAEQFKDHCNINGNRLYHSADSLQHIQQQYEYLVLDFGNFQSCNLSLFQQSTYKVICCGIKPWETEQINHTFRDNDGSFRYIFSFVPPADWKDIQAQMQEFSNNTFFAPYSPDMFHYNGCDDLYSNLLQE